MDSRLHLIRKALLLASAVAGTLTGRAEQAAADPAAPAAFPPQEYDVSRYENLQAKSPFEFELKAPPPPEVADPFEGMVLAGYVGSTKNLTVYLVNTKANGERISVYSDASPRKASDKTGIRIVGLNRGRTLKATTVILEKDGQQKEIGFDETALSNMKGGAAAGGPQGGPQLPGNMRGPGIPRPGQPAPGAALPVQPYQAPQAVVPGMNNAQPNPGAAAAGTVIVNGQAVPLNNNAAMVNFLAGGGQGAVPNVQGVQPIPAVQPQVQVQQPAIVNPPQPQTQPTQQGFPQGRGDRGGRDNAPPRRRVVMPSGN
jgi:hypothetical protein